MTDGGWSITQNLNLHANDSRINMVRGKDRFMKLPQVAKKLKSIAVGVNITGNHNRSVYDIQQLLFQNKLTLIAINSDNLISILLVPISDDFYHDWQ